MTIAGCGTKENTGKENVTKEEAENDVTAESEAVEWPEEITLVQMSNENNSNAGQKYDEFRQELEDEQIERIKKRQLVEE